MGLVKHTGFQIKLKLFSRYNALIKCDRLSERLFVKRLYTLFVFFYICCQPILAQNFDHDQTEQQYKHLISMIVLNKNKPFNIISAPKFIFFPDEKLEFTEGITIHCFGLNENRFKDAEDYIKKETAFWEKVEKEELKQPSPLTISLLIQNQQEQFKITQWSDQATDIPLPDGWQFLGEIYVRNNKMYFIPQNKKSEKILMQTVRNRNGQNMLVYAYITKINVDTQ